jgi:hypothetical protein
MKPPIGRGSRVSASHSRDLSAIEIHLDVLSLAFIGNASAHDKLGRRREFRAEAFSIRRLEGSRWRLRRTLGAMEIEWHFNTFEPTMWPDKQWFCWAIHPLRQSYITGQPRAISCQNEAGALSL